ncbi:SDR family NAD(P)-dependent oxidoreductase [Histidinibacterium aquaticum]|uniref:SDR family oxidoreductase n=1 Tax=Histidinibacterium aquaticum TaxID=2613962 RepID=A0A5J5GGT3_9RHOB|nr:SDR family oxidoreductase [Histidinibacterium aquaticum]KAA9006953.1 SDR family oxidoreductase [Histidinibacterium aquaticum]
MELGLNGKSALITGAGGGIGRCTARLLAAEGARLTLTDKDDETLAEVSKELDATCVAADLSSTKGAETLIGKVGHDFDIFVHAAGVTGAKGDPIKMSDEDWDHAWHTDFMSAVRLTRLVAPGMISRGWGRMVFVTSENAAQPYPDETVYNVAKTGLLSFAKSVAMAHSGKGLLVNCVAPAFIETPMTDYMMDTKAEAEGTSRDEAIEGFLESDRPYLALKRRGKPEEVAPAIALLCSERASFVTGSNWRVDGGSVGSIQL